ncbi:Opsin-1 [Arthrobotrys entomopaga]|nr:Opsin-1 [Arthrobotrys entomopaga]
MVDFDIYNMDKTHPVPIDPTSTVPIPLPTVTHSPPHYEHISRLGHSTLWVGFALMLLSTLAFIGLSWRVPLQKRLFYQITTYVTLISTFTYYAMATGGGWTYHHNWVSHGHKHDLPDTHKIVIRQIFWARYADWLLTTPMILFNLGALSGLSGANILNTILANVAMITTGLFSVYSHGGKTKWGWYAMSWLAFITVGWNLFTNARATAQKRGVHILYNPLALWTALIWTVYLIIWGVSDLGRSLNPDQVTLAYLVLDFMAKPVFGFWLLLGQGRLSTTHVNVDGFWSDGVGHREGLLRVGERDEDA